MDRLLAFTLSLAMSLVGCKESIVVPHIEEADDQVSTCKVARDPDNPLIVEWPGTDKVALDAASQRGIVAVAYRACNLKVLSSCAPGGAYAFRAVTPTRDTLIVGSVADLYAKLPLGVASLKGELSAGSQLRLDYLAVGQRFADRLPVGALPAGCEGATHFVERITVGAYTLDAEASQGVSGGVEIEGAGLGGGEKKSTRRLRGSGEIASCASNGPNTEADAQEGKCYAILQIGLVPISGPPTVIARVVPSPGGATSDPPARVADPALNPPSAVGPVTDPSKAPGAPSTMKSPVGERAQFLRISGDVSIVSSEAGRVVLTLPTGPYFEAGGAPLTPEGQGVIKRLQAELERFRPRAVRIEVHTDSRGSSERNLALSVDRARALKAELSGYSPTYAIEAEGIGEERPVAENSTDVGRTKNRRIVLVIE